MAKNAATFTCKQFSDFLPILFYKHTTGQAGQAGTVLRADIFHTAELAKHLRKFVSREITTHKPVTNRLI